eukprot:5380686-Prymnesium_polylepis.2
MICREPDVSWVHGDDRDPKFNLLLKPRTLVISSSPAFHSAQIEGCTGRTGPVRKLGTACLLYTSDAADDM